MSRRIEKAFARAAKAKRAALIPFIMAGDPTPAHTVPLALALEHAGADILELGVPFTDPIADGPTIQRSAERALRSGTTLTAVLSLVRDLRYASELPIVLFSYYNPIHAYGLARFAVDAAAAGVDAVLFTDVPVEEAAPMAEQLGRVGLDLILLVAPTSTRERIEAVRRLASGFVYFVARVGVTGARRELEAGLEKQVRAAKRLTKARIAVGFGVSSPEQVGKVAGFADGVVVGSALVERIEELGDSPDLTREVGAFLQSFASATRK
jgi:tryptophan synthase alpha chain